MKKQNQKIWIGFFIFCIFFCKTSVYAENLSLVPVGQTVGVTLDMKGVTIVDTTDVEDYDGKRHTPAKDAGLKSGDIVKSIDGISIQSARQFEDVVNTRGKNELTVVSERNGKQRECVAKAVLSCKDGHYRLGVWIKDAASGIGTLTYFNPETGQFGALGHGICENDKILPIQGGNLLKSSIVSIRKGSKGQPGELIGVFRDDSGILGEIKSNSDVGLKGTLNEIPENTEGALPVANREDVKEGNAQILSNIEEDHVEKFDVIIQKINKDPNNTRGMIIKVTDDRLLEKTGGIVQGMSGSPVVQNGKLVGAVTHVFVNDPTRGYGIFIENMLSEAEKIK